MSLNALTPEQSQGFAQRITALLGTGLPDEGYLNDAIRYLTGPEPSPTSAFDMLSLWLIDNTDEFFEEQPDVDGIRIDLHEAVWGK